MAARRRLFQPNEILGELVTTIESENEDSDPDYAEDSTDSSSEHEDDIEREFGVADGAGDVPAARPRPTGMPGVRTWRDGVFSPNLFEFDEVNSGINPAFGITTETCEKDIFKIFFDKTMVELIVEQTQKYYDYVFAHQMFKDNSRLHKWLPITVSECYEFLAIFMLMSFQKKSKLSDYWSTDKLIHTPIFGSLMSCDRFLLILRLLHFSNNEQQVDGDRLHKIRPVLNNLKQKYKEVLIPYKNLCIDESLLLWKGRLSFRQYIPNKRKRFGIKTFILCDCQTGFILDIIVYTGATTAITNYPDVGISGSIVLTLLEPYLEKGHTLSVDNWYSSPDLFDKLYSTNTGACGTVRSNRKGMPKFPPKLQKGQCVNKHTDTLLACKWHDKRDVHMLSSVHKPNMRGTGKHDRQTGEEMQKPECVLEYNKFMGSVDKADMEISFVDSTRKTLKWYKKLFFHLLDVSILNSFYIFKEARGIKLELSIFKLEVIRQLIEEHHIERKSRKGGRPSASEDPLRLKEKHFPSLVPSTEKRKNAMRKCTVCAHSTKRPQKRKDSRYECLECNVGLCVVPCFKEFHTLKYY